MEEDAVDCCDDGVARGVVAWEAETCETADWEGMDGAGDWGGGVAGIVELDDICEDGGDASCALRRLRVMLEGKYLGEKWSLWGTESWGRITCWDQYKETLY